jgi:hypothetical protein
LISCCHAGYFYKKYPGFKKRQQNAQQDFKIVHYYYPALPLLSSIACNAAAMLKDQMHFLLHLQQHGLQHCKQCWIIIMYGVHSDSGRM